VVVDEGLRSERDLDGVIWLDDVDRSDADRVGEKAATLGALARGGFQVPPGFVVTTDTYLAAMERAGVREELRESARRLGDQLAAAAAERLHALVRHVGAPRHLRLALDHAYRELGDRPFVAVRSSHVGADLAERSNHAETFINVRGVDEVVACVVECWAWLFGPRACAIRASCGWTDEPRIAVLVQEMADVVSGGVMYTDDRSQPGTSCMVIHSARGLGGCFVEGGVDPDVHVVNRNGPAIVSSRIGSRAYELERHPEGGQRRVAVARGAALTRDAILELAKLGLAIEAHEGEPQLIDWVRTPEGFSLVGSRPSR
jgi:pyruvate, water dikinase